MQTWYFVAGVLAAVTGLVHSVLGERLIFRHLRRGSVVPGGAAPPLQSRHIRILWATWHIGSVFGWAFAGVLFQLALAPGDLALRPLLVTAIFFGYLGSSLLVLIGTKGRHPGWIALLLVAVFTWLAAGGSH